MNKRKKIYEGKAKILYEGPKKNTAIQYFKDHATAFNNQKKSTIEGKGILNNKISWHIFSELHKIGIKTHLIKRLKFVKKNAPELKISLSSNMEVWKPELTKIIVSEVLISSMRFSILAYTPKASNRIYGDNLLTEKARHQIDYFLSANAIAGHPIWTEVYTLMFQDQKGEVEKIKNRYWELVDEFEIWQPHGWSNRYPEFRSKQKNRIKCKSVMEMDQPMIGIQGDFIPCSMDINYKLSLGNIGTNTVEQILDGQKCRELSELNQSGKLEDKPTCKGCVYLNADNSDVLYESKSMRKRIDR